MTNNETPDPFADTCGHPVCDPGHCNCHVSTRATSFIATCTTAELTDAQIHHIVDDALDIDAYDTHNVPAGLDIAVADHVLMNAQSHFTSDDDYDDFRREVSAVLAGDDACASCGYDPDDCECDDDEDIEADPIDLQDVAEGRF